MKKNQRGLRAAFSFYGPFSWTGMGVMASYPVEIRRCRHLKTNGTQCGSPALKGKELCYYHEQNRPEPVELYMDGERYCDGRIVLPVFEDAHSIQTVIRQVVQLMLTRRIERKDAGLLLYALQIASGNLKTMLAEKAKPTQVVVEPDKAAETPLGMTPWSATGQGHDPDEEGEETEAQNSPAPPPSPEEVDAAMSMVERIAKTKNLEHRGWVCPGEFEEYLFREGPDPLRLAKDRLWAAEREGRKQSESPHSQNPEDQPLPPGTIQACRARSARTGGR
jgi:hypothetical protein